MNKRILSIVLLFALLLTMLPGMPFSAQAAQEEVFISLWTYPIGAWGDEVTVKKLIAGFQEAYPHITVNVTCTNYATGDQDLEAAIQNGNIPDIIFEAPERLVATWGEMGALVDLSDLLDEQDALELIPNAVSAGRGSDGKLYLYPLCGTVHSMAINKTVFEAAGAMQYLNEQTHTWNSTEDFFRAVQTVYEYTGKRVGAVYCGGQGGDQGTRALVNNLYGGTYTDAAHTRYTWNTQENIDALQALYDCEGLEFDSGIVGGDDIAAFLSGNQNLTICWNVNQYGFHQTTSNGDEILPMAFPSNGDPALASGVWGFSLFDNQDDARTEASKLFIRYMCDSAATADAVKASGFQPVRSAAEGVALSGMYDDIPWRKPYMEMMPMMGDYYVVTPNWAESRTAWWNMLVEIAAGADIPSTVESYNGWANNHLESKTEISALVPVYSHLSADWWAQFEKDFEELHPDVDLQLIVTSWNEIYGLVDGVNPDILQIDGYEGYISRLLPVDAYLSEYTLGKFTNDYLSQSESDGKVWAIPDLTSLRGLFCNTELFAGAGVEIPNTWAELEAACAALKAHYGDAIIPWAVDMSHDDGSSTFTLLTGSNDGGWLDENGDWALNSQENVDALEFAVSLYQQGYTNPDPGNESRYDLQDRFCAGEVAMILAPDSFCGRITDVAYQVTTISANEGKTASTVGVMDRFMCFDNDYSEAELKAIRWFFDFFYEDERYVNWTQMEGFLPATSTGMNLLAEQDASMAVWAELFEEVEFLPAEKENWLDVRAAVVDAMAQALNGDDVKTLLDAVQTECVRKETIIAEGTCGENVTWTLDRNGHLTIEGEGTMESIDWLQYKDAILSVSIGDGVTTIAAYAFQSCSNMISIDIPDSVTYIGDEAFFHCSGLTSIDLPAGLTTISDYAFFGCGDLGCIEIPEGVTYIGERAFEHSSMTCIIFTGDAPNISSSAFTSITTTAYYPADNETWTEEKLQNYGGSITWVAVEAAYTPGDITGDGKVNNRDAARLMQYLAGWDVEFVEAALDINGDGKVNNRDAARLMQYLAGWDVEIN